MGMSVENKKPVSFEELVDLLNSELPANDPASDLANDPVVTDVEFEKEAE